MKTLTKEELLSLPFSPSACNILNDEFCRHDEGDEYFRFESWAYGDISLETECGIAISFGWRAEGGEETYKSAFDFNISRDENITIELYNACVVDDEADELAHWEIQDALDELLNDNDWETTVQEQLPAPGFEAIDLKETKYMKNYTVERDNDRAIKFTGEQIASATDSTTGGRETMNLYRTQQGKYICETIVDTYSQGNIWSSYNGAVREREDEVIEFFGLSSQAKELYAEANINAFLEVA